MSLSAKRDIKRGEEIFVNYNYKLAWAPQWYRDQWFAHLRTELGWSERKIQDWVQCLYRTTGILVQISELS